MPKSYVLTLYFTKDKSTFDIVNYKSVLEQRGVIQDVIVISASSIDTENNITVKVLDTWPLQVRIGFSFNIVTQKINLKKYTHIFKVDGDVQLPSDYLYNLLNKRTAVAGIGAALLFSIPFFKVALNSKYPISYCDDGYIAAVSIALGIWPPKYDGQGKVIIPPVKYYLRREFFYGIEYYRWGMPWWLVASMFILSYILKYKLEKYEYRTYQV